MDNNIKDFFLTDAIEEDNTEEKTKKHAVIDYQTVVVSGPDFVIRRKTSKSSKLLVILLSRDEYYIKDERTGAISPLTEKELQSFLKDCNNSISIADENGNKPFWIENLFNNFKFRRLFLYSLTNESFRKLACKNIATLPQIPEYGMIDSLCFYGYSEGYTSNLINIELCETVFKILSAELGHEEAKIAMNSGRRRHTKYSSLIQQIDCRGNQGLLSEVLNKHGISGLRTFIQMYINTPVAYLMDRSTWINIHQRRRSQNNTLENISVVNTEFEFQHLVDYLFCECTRQGFASCPERFYRTWYDYLNMSYMLYGKIEDKYPENLLSQEFVLSDKVRQHQELLKEKGFKEVAEAAANYEYTGICSGEKYNIIAPKEALDIIDEATQQSNCVASYIPQMASGQCYIFFMRKAKSPEKSLITIEVSFDGNDKTPRLGQVKARFNREPSFEQKKFVKTWFEKFFVNDNKELKTA